MICFDEGVCCKRHLSYHVYICPLKGGIVKYGENISFGRCVDFGNSLRVSLV